MDDDLWAVSSSGSSISHRSAATTIKYQSGSYVDMEDFEEEDDDDYVADDYQCPFCSDDYDLIELCHHIDEEHQLEATNYGLCPVCNKRVKMHMVDHITTLHRDLLKSDQKQSSSYEDHPYSSDKFLYDELGQIMNDHRSSKTIVADPFLSFINNSPLPKQTTSVQPDDYSVEEESLVKESLAGKEVKTTPALSDSEQLEKAKKCEFVQGLLSSAMFGDEYDNF